LDLERTVAGIVGATLYRFVLIRGATGAKYDFDGISQGSTAAFPSTAPITGLGGACLFLNPFSFFVIVGGEYLTGMPPTPTASQDAYTYNPANNQWITNTNFLPVPRSRLSCATSNGKAYFVGGRDATALTNRLDIFDGQTMNPGAPLPISVEYATAVIHNDHLYLLGGLNSQSTAVASVQKYQLSSNMWLPPVQNMLTSRSRFGASVISAPCGIRIITYGSSTSQHDAEWYDINANVWSTAEPSSAVILAKPAIQGQMTDAAQKIVIAVTTTDIFRRVSP